MRIIAVDDELLQLETICEYISELYPDASVLGFCKVSEVLAYPDLDTVDLAILDISMPGNINGIHLGEILREKNRHMKLLYCSGYTNYAMDAFRLHANGYLQKPVCKEELLQEMQYVLQMPVFDGQTKPCIHTFGNFDLFYNDRPVLFRRSKSKEILAYLTDREGGWASNRELAVVLWDESGSELAMTKYITTLVRDLMLDLEDAGVAHIVERQRGKIRLLKSEVLCDYFDFLAGDPLAISQFRGEYMKQYSWGEITLAYLHQAKP